MTGLKCIWKTALLGSLQTYTSRLGFLSLYMWTPVCSYDINTPAPGFVNWPYRLSEIWYSTDKVLKKYNSRWKYQSALRGRALPSSAQAYPECSQLHDFISAFLSSWHAWQVPASCWQLAPQFGAKGAGTASTGSFTAFWLMANAINPKRPRKPIKSRPYIRLHWLDWEYGHRLRSWW